MFVYLLAFILVKEILSDRNYTKNAIIRMLKDTSMEFDIQELQMSMEDKYKIANLIHKEEFLIGELFWEYFNEEQKLRSKDRVLTDKLVDLINEERKSHSERIRKEIDRIDKIFKQRPVNSDNYLSKLDKISEKFADYENELLFELYQYKKQKEDLVKTIRESISAAVLNSEFYMYRFEDIDDYITVSSEERKIIRNRYLKYIKAAEIYEIVQWINDLPFFKEMIINLERVHDSIISKKSLPQLENGTENILRIIYDKIYEVLNNKLVFGHIYVPDNTCDISITEDDKEKCLIYKRLSNLLQIDDILHIFNKQR